MTTTTPAAIRLHKDDPRLGLATAIGLAGAVIARVGPDQLPGPTLSLDVSVRDLLRQMVATLGLVAAAPWGEHAPAEAAGGKDGVRASSVPDTGWVGASGVPDSAWVEAWDQVAHEADAAWARPGLLERTIALPFGELPGAAVLAIYTGRITIQAWELAIATQRPGWDAGTVAAALAASGWAGRPTR